MKLRYLIYNQQLKCRIFLLSILLTVTAIEVLLIIFCSNQIKIENEFEDNVIKVNCSIIKCFSDGTESIIEYFYNNITKNETIGHQKDYVNFCPKYLPCYYLEDNMESLSLTQITYNASIIAVLMLAIILICVLIISIMIILIMNLCNYNSEHQPLLDGININQLYEDND